MKTKKLNRILSVICAISFVLFILAILAPKAQRTAPKPFDSAILNPQYRNSVYTISIEKNGQKLTLKKQGDFWLVSSEKKSTIADSNLVKLLLDESEKMRKLYIVSETSLNWAQLSLGEANAGIISFSKNNDIVYTKLYLGITNSVTNRITLRTNLTENSYETENSYSQYLNLDINYWSLGKIFSALENISSITFTSENSTLELNSSTPDFESKTYTLKNLRHGKIYEAEKISDLIKIATVQAYSGSGRKIMLNFFKGQIEGQYFYNKALHPSKIDSQENIDALNSENCVYEISGWTFDRIKDLFN